MLSTTRLHAFAAAAIAAIVLGGCSGGSGSTYTGTPAMPDSVDSQPSSAGPSTAPADVASMSTLDVRHTTAVTTGEQAVSSDAFVNSMGVNVHLWWGPYLNFPAVQSALTGLGVRHIRDGMVWVSWGTGYYDKLNALAAAGVHSTLVTALDQDPAKIATYIKFVPSLEAIEAPNEPNVGQRNITWVAPVRAFQQALYTAVRGNAANANVTVLGPAVAYTDAAYGVLGNLSPYLDAGNVHDYFGGNAPDIAWISARMGGAAAVSGSKKIVATETGYCTANGNQGVTESAMGKYIPRAFFEQFNAGITRTLEFELIDENSNLNSFWSQCGLLRYNFTPKPAYTALKNLIVLLRDQTPVAARTSLAYTLLGNTAAVHHMLLQKNDGTLYLAMWLNSSVFDQSKHLAISVAPQPVAINFGTAVTSLQAYTFDAAGGLTPQTIAVTRNSAQVNVTDSVTLYKIAKGIENGSPNVAPVVTGPIAHWSFNEGSGATSADSVSATRNAVFSGTPTWTAGLFGSAIALTPAVHLTAPAGIIDTSRSYSISAWLLLGDTTASHTAITVEGSQTPAFALSYKPGSGFKFIVNGKDTTWHTPWMQAQQSGFTPAVGTWYNVAATFDKPNCKIGLFVNGVLQQSVPGCLAFKASGTTHFGAGLWQTWTGAIDEVNFYGRVLTGAELTSLAQS